MVFGGEFFRWSPLVGPLEGCELVLARHLPPLTQVPLTSAVPLLSARKAFDTLIVTEGNFCIGMLPIHMLCILD